MTSLRRHPTIAVALVLVSLSSCSRPVDPELAGFCDRAVTAVQLNGKATEHGVERSPEELGKQMAAAALASEAFLRGVGPADIQDEMTTVNQYHEGERGNIDAEYFEAYLVVRDFSASHCDGLTLEQNGRLRFVP